MEARENWHALQARLDAARELLAAGDRSKALEAIEAALEIDPNFLGAQLLRDQMLRGQAQASPGTAPLPPLGASSEEFAQFEQRARRRRTERRLEAARAALAARREREARQAIEELSDLEPDLPGLRELTVQANDLRRSNLRPRVAGWLAAATACFTVTFATLSIERSRSVSRRPSSVDDRAASRGAPAPVSVAPAASGPVVAPTESAVPMVAASGATPTPSNVATGGSVSKAQRQAKAAGRSGPSDRAERRVRVGQAIAKAGGAPELPEATRPSPIEAPRPSSTEPPRSKVPLATPPSEPVAPPSPVSPVAPTDVLSARGQAVPAPVSTSGDDTALVQTVLQRYRRAYEGLDARSAAAVWPAVNVSALARAFDGLASQALIFDVCYVKLEGNAADAICRGSARYVPKVGRREPRIESRVWTFALRKAGSDWRIENARAEH